MSRSQSWIAGRTGRLAALGVAVLVPLGVVTALATTNTAAAATGFGVAPYVDMTNNQEPILNSAVSTGGLKAFTAAFVISSGCTPIWGDTLPVTNDPTVTGDINSAEAAGAQLIVSFGGEGGVELAQGCTNQASLTAAYQSVINTLHPTRIDFDVEGAAIADPTSINLRFHAIAALEQANPGLIVSVTIPVLPTGPDGNGDTFLQDAKADGARIDLINIMTMDYGPSFDSPTPEMGNFAVQAAQDTLSFVKTVFPSDTFANIGVTPMIGVNDDASEVFTEADAHTLVNFANANGIGRLAFWSVDRDQPCGGTANGLPSCSEITQTKLDFTKIFTGFTGAGGGTVAPPPPTSNPPTSTPPTSTAPPPSTGLVANGGFESGALSPWTCDAGTASVVASPVHTGTHALSGAATSSDDAQCTQSVAVQANHTYTLSAWVQGNFAFIGTTGTGTTDPSTFTQAAPSYTQLTTTFTTGAATTHVTVFVHGWFAQGTVHFDDVALS
jgi:hypothetical protein